MTTTSTKRCYICGMYKELTAFAPNAAKADGLRDECQPCRSIENRVKNARYRAQTAGAAADLTIRQLRDLMYLFTSCLYCGKDLEDLPAAAVQVDHVVPLVRGGSSSSGNLVLCCATCNSRKGNKPAGLFAESRTPLIRYMAMESGISREEAAAILLTDALEYSNIESAEQIAATAVVLDGFGISYDMPIDLLVDAIQHYFMNRFGLQIDDPEDIAAIHQAVQLLKEFMTQPEGSN